MSHVSLHRIRAAVFLGMLVLVFVSAPFVQDLPRGDVVDGLLGTMVLCTAAWAVGAHHRQLIAAICLAVPAVATRWINLAWPTVLPHWVPSAAFLVFLAHAVGLHMRFILRSPRVTSEVLCAAVSTYLLLGILWATAYMTVGRMNPAAFAGLAADKPLLTFDSLYFSMITLTTVGYGDITPVSGPARMLAMIEAFTGTMYVAVLVARLVSLYTVEIAAGSDRAERR